MNNNIFAAITVLAVLVEAVVEYLFGKIEEFPNLNSRIAAVIKWCLPYLSVAVGIGLCFGYKVDVLRDVLGMTTAVPATGYVLTGIVISRGANFVNDFISLVKSHTAKHLTSARRGV